MVKVASWFSTSCLPCSEHLASPLEPRISDHILEDEQDQFLFAAGPRGVPGPSFRVWVASGARFSNFWRRPLGQRTSTQSSLLALPRPKWTRMSLLERKLEPLRTSSIKMRVPAFTRMRAPMASRLDFFAPAEFSDAGGAPMARRAIQ